MKRLALAIALMATLLATPVMAAEQPTELQKQIDATTAQMMRVISGWGTQLIQDEAAIRQLQAEVRELQAKTATPPVPAPKAP